MLCAQTRRLKCGADQVTCEKACAEMHDAPICQDAMRRALRCLAKEPDAHWECDTSGMAAIKAGHCDAEQSGVATCIQSASGP